MKSKQAFNSAVVFVCAESAENPGRTATVEFAGVRIPPHWLFLGHRGPDSNEISYGWSLRHPARAIVPAVIGDKLHDAEFRRNGRRETEPEDEHVSTLLIH